MANHKLLGGFLMLVGGVNVALNVYNYYLGKNTSSLVNGDLLWVVAIYGGYLLYTGK